MSVAEGGGRRDRVVAQHTRAAEPLAGTMLPPSKLMDGAQSQAQVLSTLAALVRPAASSEVIPWRQRARANGSGAVGAQPARPIVNPAGLEARKGCTDALKLLTYNIQVGITTRRYRHYLTKGWKHVLPHEARARNLRRIARVVADYDVVALQEVDSGSIRSGFINQVEYLAREARFRYWYAQLNRDLGPLAQHGNGMLSRVAPETLEDHKLPGRIPGRGAIVLRVRLGTTPVTLVLLHLSLGGRSRQLQLAYVRTLIERDPHVVVMGDMNSHLADLLDDSPLAGCGLTPAGVVPATYPSWRPVLALDHIIATQGLTVQSYGALDCDVSDHLPIAVSVGCRVADDAPQLPEVPPELVAARIVAPGARLPA